MPDCGVIEFLRGGMVAEAYIASSNVTDSHISSSEITGCHLKSMASVDEASAQTIADALVKLSPCMLAELAKAILAAMPQVSPGQEPPITSDVSLPSAVAGGRDVLLGEPAAWLDYQDYIIPAYKEGE